MSEIALEGVINKPKDNKPAITTGTYDSQKGTQSFCRFRIGVYQGKDKEGNATYGNYNCVIYGDLADNAIKLLKAGDHVVVIGRQKIERFQTQDGALFTQINITVSAIGKAISRFAPQGNEQYNSATGTIGKVQYSEPNNVAAANNRTQTPQAPTDDEFPLDFGEYDNPQNSGEDVPIPF